MDFQSLARRELQFLCKKNSIPANMTNVAMADALRALPSVEGMGEIQDPSDFLSPKKAEVSSQVAPRTTRRTSVRKKIEPVEASKEQTASPLPRARRVTAETSEIMRMVYQEEEKGVEEEKQRHEEIVPDSKPQATVPRSMRRRATEKEEGADENANVVQVSSTPATRNGPRIATRRGTATPIPAEEVEEDRSRTTRRTRQSVRAIPTAATTTVGTRSCRRGKAAALVSKMEPFGTQEEPQKEEMQQEKDETYQNIQDILGGSVKESPDQGEAFCSLNSLVKVAGSAKEDEVIQGMEKVHEEQLSEVEDGSQGLLAPHNQTSGQEESTESQVAEDLIEYDTEMQVTCQEDQATEECQQLVEKKQEDFALLGQEESPIKGLITEYQQKKQDECSICLSGNQTMAVETNSIGLESIEISDAELENDDEVSSEILEETPGSITETAAFFPVANVDSALGHASKSEEEKASDNTCMDASEVIQVKTKPGGAKQDVSKLSLRSLKKIYKGEMINQANKVEGKRMPLLEIKR